MSGFASLSARQLRRAAEIKEEIQTLENELNRLAASPNRSDIRILPRRRGRLMAAIKTGVSAAVHSPWTRTGVRVLVLPAQRIKRQLAGAARAKIASAARSRLERMRNIHIP